MLDTHGIRMSWSQEDAPTPRRSLPERASSRPNSGSLGVSPSATPFQLRTALHPSELPFQASASSSDAGRGARETRLTASLHSLGLGSTRRQDSFSSVGRCAGWCAGCVSLRHSRPLCSPSHPAQALRASHAVHSCSGVSAMSRDVSVSRESHAAARDGSAASSVVHAMQGVEQHPPAERK